MRSSRLTILLAVVLFVAALLVAWMGIQFSKTEPTPEPEPQTVVQKAADVLPVQQLNDLLAEEEDPRVAVVVLAREVKAMSRLTAEDLLVEELKLAPPGSFADSEALLDKVVWRDLPAGTVLNDTSFAQGGPLAQMIRPQERALAIDVDEATALGGHLEPGDYVDALLYLRQDERNTDRTVQVVVPSLRVLSVGARLGGSNEGEPLMEPEPESDENNRRARSSQAQVPRSVVLAVPEALQSRFYLATQVGALRLTVRSRDEKLLAAYYGGEQPSAEVEELERQLFQFEKLAVGQVKRPQPGLVAPRPAGIQVFSGQSVSRQNP